MISKLFKPKHLAIWLVVILGLLAIFFAMRPRPLPVELAVIAEGSLRVTIDEEGETRVKERFVISSPLDGKLERIELDPGDRVSINETVLARLRPKAPSFMDSRQKSEAQGRFKAAEAARGQAEAERDRARSEKEFQESELARYKSLGEIASRERVDLASRNAHSAGEALRSAEFALRNAEFDLAVARAGLMDPRSSDMGEPILIYAPIDGVVLKKYHESETMVGVGEKLVEVADPRQLEIVADLLSTDAVKVRKGQKVVIDRWGGEQELSGSVRIVEPSGFTKVSALGVEEQRVNTIIDPNSDASGLETLGDGFRVEVKVVIWEEDHVVRVPGSALFRAGDDWAVFCQEEGRARLRKIRIGRRNGLFAQVLEGLELGEQVIVHPSDSIGDGVLIKAR